MNWEGARLVYFPASAIVFMPSVLENGSTVEIAVVGNEGLVDISLFIDGESLCSRSVAQMHHGEVDVFSAGAGDGSSLAVTLPAPVQSI